MGIEISQRTEIRLIEEARRQGVSVDALVERLIDERNPAASGAERCVPELPILHLGPMGPLHRRDIYDDAG